MRVVPSIHLLTVLTAGLLVAAPTVALAAAGSATVHWTAPGDDSLTGRASAYDLRYSLTPITTANFLLATKVLGLPAPRPSGSAESFKISGLTAGTGYFFALETVDDASNWSGLSNVAYYSIGTTSVVAPPDYRLSSPWPNPAQVSAHWEFALPAAGPVEIVAFDVTGRQVRRIFAARCGAGVGAAAWDLNDDAGRHVASGVYLVRASLGGRTSVQRLAVVR